MGGTSRRGAYECNTYLRYVATPSQRGRDPEGGLYVPRYSDQVLPFDVTLAANNEHGAARAMRIYGIEILNEGSAVSIDDAVTEMQATFVARYIQPWRGGADQGPPSWARKNPSRARGGLGGCGTRRLRVAS